MHENFYVRTAAILGAGVMGAQIAAHFGNAGIPVVLFDLKANRGGANDLVKKAIESLKKLSPKPLAGSKTLDYITIANYDDNLDLLVECDLIIEAIAERIDWKEALYSKISNYVNDHAIIASNTSGLSIDLLSKSLPEKLRSRFCGIHFFNPPRYMPLVELIPHQKTDEKVLPMLETFLVTNMGKSVIHAKDTPNFIANRLGVFSMLVTCIHSEKYNIPLEVVDQLTGKNLGRPKSATFRTADVVGLDVFTHASKTMLDNCRDGWEACYKTPAWMDKLMAAGALGQKTKAGVFKKDKDGIKVIDLATGEYRLADKKADAKVLEILRIKNWDQKLEALKNSDSPEAQFLVACFRDIFHYCAVLLGEIADTPRDMDFALRWGFGWNEGVFEIWQNAGWHKIAKWLDSEIEAGRTLGNKKLPEWVFKLDSGVYIDNKHFNIKKNAYVERISLPVYKRQLFPDLVINEKPDINEIVLYENDGVRLWHTGDDIGILSFKTKMCTINNDVLTGINEAVKIAEAKCIGMVIWQYKDVFSAGANLEEFGFSFMMNGEDGVKQVISDGHRAITQNIRYCKVPIIAAVKGFAFGGGCEIMLHCHGVVAALESYIGLVEAGVGLLPGWGGTTEMAYRASLAIDPWKDFEKRYKNLAMAQVAGSAREAQEMGFLRDSDSIVMNSKEILLIAKEKAKFLSVSGFRPPVPAKFKVFGKQGIATVNGLLANMYAGGQISEHDLLIARNIAIVMCGGEIENGTEVSVNWVLNVEKEKFIELATTQKTAARIEYMLTNGKPLRN
ncbi:MAG: 3-hydroxyacyl-CoA dehydrogenase [Burkholderiales bacterium]|jgi:3-hydroxyacyl-CoA dehydrogenase|nr:3-hydroxyacyl-CoA dehydrogenase [Burkholderiales bacterium]